MTTLYRRSALGSGSALPRFICIGWAAAVGVVVAGCSVDERTVHNPTDGSRPIRDAVASEILMDASVVSSGDGATRKVVLFPDRDGFVDRSNQAGVVGHWYAYLDSRGDNFQSPGSCQLLGGFRDDQCSSMTEPATYPPFRTVDSIHGAMCTTGVAAQVIDSPITGLLDFDHIWGGGIGLDFNNVGASITDVAVYNALAHHVIGVSFVINSPPPSGRLRVQFPTADNPATGGVWNRAVAPGFNTVLWKDVVNTTYLTNPPPFDPALVLTVQFNVVASTDAPTFFSFCVSDFAMLLE